VLDDPDYKAHIEQVLMRQRDFHVGTRVMVRTTVCQAGHAGTRAGGWLVGGQAGRQAGRQATPPRATKRVCLVAPCMAAVAVVTVAIAVWY
jgi:hypothetical protein